MGPRQCEVCKEAQSKYKCPSCLVPYCSLACFKRHKENPCKKSSPPVEDLKNPCKKSPPVEDLKNPCKKSSNPVEDLENPCKMSPPVEDLIDAENPCKKSSNPMEDFENPCEKSSPPVEYSTTMVLPERLYGPDEANWVLSKEQLISIVKSNEIRDALADRELRNLIHKIDSSKEPEDELYKAMEGQTFREFTSKILDIVSPQE